MFETVFTFSISSNLEDQSQVWHEISDKVTALTGVSGFEIADATSRVTDARVAIATESLAAAKKLHDRIMRTLSGEKNIAVLGMSYDLKKMSGRS